MNVKLLAIQDVVLIEPTIYEDERGYFFESFNTTEFSKAISRPINFVQDNESLSRQGVLRGLHYQTIRPQAKLVRVSAGEIFDVAVDIRLGSSTFGRWVGERLSAENKTQLWIPEGFAHGFFVLSETAQVQYKVTEYRFPEYEHCIKFDDADIGIEWPALLHASSLLSIPLLSKKDRLGKAFAKAENLPRIS